MTKRPHFILSLGVCVGLAVSCSDDDVQTNPHFTAGTSSVAGAPAGGEPALAIKSTVGPLRECVAPHREPPMGEPLILGVHYRDYSKEAVETGMHLAPLLQKRRSFEHEREVRVLVQRLPHLGAPSSAGQRYDTACEPEPGIRLDVDLNRLIQEVYVSPEAPSRFLKVVEGLAATYGLTAPVRQSPLLTGAIF